MVEKFGFPLMVFAVIRSPLALLNEPFPLAANPAVSQLWPAHGRLHCLQLTSGLSVIPFEMVLVLRSAGLVKSVLRKE